jgi:hypothetical protein
LPAQRLRAVLSSRPSPESLLQRVVPPGGAALAAASGEPDLASERGGPALPSGASAALSSADPLAHAVRSAGSRGDRSGSPTGGDGVRGPAPRVKSWGLFRSFLPAARLLRAVRSHRRAIAAVFLFVPLPSGVAERAGSGVALSASASGGLPTAATTSAAGGVAAAVMSFAVVRWRSPREDRSYPPRRRR